MRSAARDVAAGVREWSTCRCGGYKPAGSGGEIDELKRQGRLDRLTETKG